MYRNKNNGSLIYKVYDNPCEYGVISICESKTSPIVVINIPRVDFNNNYEEVNGYTPYYVYTLFMSHALQYGASDGVVNYLRNLYGHENKNVFNNKANKIRELYNMWWAKNNKPTAKAIARAKKAYNERDFFKRVEYYENDDDLINESKQYYAEITAAAKSMSTVARRLLDKFGDNKSIAELQALFNLIWQRYRPNESIKHYFVVLRYARLNGRTITS